MVAHISQLLDDDDASYHILGRSEQREERAGGPHDSHVIHGSQGARQLAITGKDLVFVGRAAACIDHTWGAS